MKLSIVSTYLYPLKSGGALESETLFVGTHGIKYDRLFGIAREGVVLTQRELGKLAQIRPITITQQWTMMDFAGTQIFLSNYGRTNSALFKIWGTDVTLDILSVASQRVSELLGEDLTVVRFGSKADRLDKRAATDSEVRVKLVDGSQVLLTNRASLDAVNSQLPTPVNMMAFRPNVVVSGAAAWHEDEWQTLRVVGKAITLHRIGPCMRCEITTHDPDTGNSLGKQPLAWLGKNRRQKFVYPDQKERTGAAFGNYYQIDANLNATINQGDELEVVW